MQIKIADRQIGPGCPPFIIAEAGMNHNGQLERAFAMIRLAKATGADAVKFQTFKAEDFVSDPNLTYTYRSQGQEVTESMLAMFKRCEFSRAEWFAIKKKCDEEAILFLSTPQNRTDLDLLLEVGIPAVKVGSDDFINIPLLKSYTQTDLPMIISCGMADLGEVFQSLEAIGALEGYPTVLLLCTSQYPTPPEDVNLLKLTTLAAAFPMVVLGFSDHTQGALASGLAAALGAVVFEKHFTLDHNLPGPDHWFSEDPDGLSEWVSTIRKSFRMLGQSLVKPTAAEKEMRILARRSIVALTDLAQGEILTSQNLGLKRPGSGLEPVLYERLLDRKTTRKIARGALIKMGDFE